MEDNEDVPDEDSDLEFEERALDALRKVIPVLRVAKNASKAVRRLSSVRAVSRIGSAGTDFITAALEAGTSRFRLTKARNEHLISKISELSEFSTEQSAAAITVLDRQIEEQLRIDQVVFKAIEHVQDSEHSSPSEEGKSEGVEGEIDDDWLESFRREAADRSQGEMRETFARILAGEIRDPGTFSIRTVRTVGSLSQSTASLFRKAASLRVSMEIMASQDGAAPRLLVLDARIPSLGGNLGDNHLRDEGLDYGRLIELTENGLLHHDYSSWRTYNVAMPNPQLGGRATIPLVHQDQQWVLVPQPDFRDGSELRIYGAAFTTVGSELLKIVDTERDAAFLEKVRTYLKRQHVEMIPTTT